MKTPVVLIIYHRPEMTRGVIDSLRQVKPSEIFVIADGPKDDDDAIKCNEARSLVDQIDWKCRIHKIYSSTNLGLRKRVVSGLNHVFSKVDRAIILEDDLVIDKSFYAFCEQMLEKYKDNSKIISIAGNNFLLTDNNIIKDSYYFSHHIYSWGWATWRRAWNLYDDKMGKWLEIRRSHQLEKQFKTKEACLYWTGIFDLTSNKTFNSWAYVWTFTAFTNEMLSIIPSVNLVSNIGTGRGATHTALKSKVIGLPIESMKFPLKHPELVQRNIQADSIVEKTLYVKFRNVVGLIIKYLWNNIKK